MPKLTIDTKKSLFDPIEIEIDGKVYTVKRVDRTMLKEIETLDQETAEGKLNAAYKRLELFLGTDIDDEVIGKLDLLELVKITNFILTNIFESGEQGKNGIKPGDKVSPS